MELDEIIEDDADKVLHPTLAPGQVPKEWLDEAYATPFSSVPCQLRPED